MFQAASSALAVSLFGMFLAAASVADTPPAATSPASWPPSSTLRTRTKDGELDPKELEQLVQALSHPPLHPLRGPGN